MKKELTPLLLLLSAIVVFSLVSFFGMFYNFGKSIYHIWKLKPIKALKSFVYYWLHFLYQIWNVLKYFMMKTAVAIDLFGNVAGGEMIEDIVTKEEYTLYGKGRWTVSAATGKLEFNNELNKTGIWFTNILSKVLGKNHSIEAYFKELTNEANS